jgi:DNA-binding MarR family transcriptional regulator
MGINRTKYLQTLDTLTDALGRSEGQSPEEIKADIKDEGIDVDAALARLKKAQLSISMAAKRSALDSAREKRLKLVEKGHEFIGRFSDWTRDQVMERIKELSGPEAGLAYRDLEAMGTEEMVSILEDLEMAHRSSMEESDDSE